jgi:hypothetical protein
MEQRQYANRVAAAAKRDLAEARALELEAKHPQLSLYDNQPEHSEEFRGGGMSGGEAGLRRVVGGRKKATKKAVIHDAMKMEADKMEASDDDKYEGGARQGRMLARHMKSMYGDGFMREFMHGYGSLSGGAMYQVAHSPMMASRVGLAGAATGGQDVPPGGMTPVAYGNAPQAPASFERNTVGMGRSGGGKLTISHGGEMKGMGKLSISHGDSCVGAGKKKRAPSARNQMISKLMKEKGMTLPEASRYLKQHGSA